MKPKAFAEKIVLYVVPFVFNIHYNILVYNLHRNGQKSTINEKTFSNDNDIQDTFQTQINLLFRINHYDVYYKYNFYIFHQNNLKILLNRNEDIDNLEENIINENENNNGKNNNLEGNILNIDDNNNNDNKNNIKDNNIKNDIEKDKKEEFSNKNINHINNEENNLSQNNKINQSICLECKKPYLKEENIFGLCDNCLSNQLKLFLLIAYFEFIKDGNNLVNSTDKFEELLKQKKCKISVQENISLYEAIYNTKFKFDDLFISVRSQLCIFCGKLNNIDEYFVELPCKCRLCSKRCFNHYLDYIQGRIKPNHEIHPTYLKYFNFLNCFCGFDYNTQNVLNMVKELETKQMNEKKRIYQDYIFNLWNWKCCICKKNFETNKSFLKIVFRCKNIDNKYLNSKTQFKHLICNECYKEKNIINDVKLINCKICDLEHEVVNTIKVNNYNEEVESEE